MWVHKSQQKVLIRVLEEKTVSETQKSVQKGRNLARERRRKKLIAGNFTNLCMGRDVGGGD